MSLYKLIESKVVEFGEIVILLFDHCNLNCSFCPQRHDSFDGTTRKEILSKIPIITKWINENHKTKQFKLHIMGGELFQDFWIEKGYLDIYQEFINDIKKEVNDDKLLIFNFVTNLVFEKTVKVLKFLEENELKVSISYDTKGRFNPSQLNIFKRNVELFKDRIEMCSLVLSKQNIDAITKGDKTFEYLYENFICDFDSFLPSVDKTDFMMPKESEVLEFNKLLIDKYPKCLNVLAFTEENKELKMSCTRGNSLTILHDNTIPKGCSGAAYLTQGLGIESSKSKDPFNVGITINFLEKYNCFECEYYKKCPFTCFIKEDYVKLVQDVDGCLIKKSFHYAEQKKNKNIFFKSATR